MRRLAGIVLFVFTITLLVFCEKRLFKTIRLKGSFVDWYNQKPVSGSILVDASKAHNDSFDTFDLAKFQTDPDGGFDKKFRAAVSGDYTIIFNGLDVRKLSIKDGSTHDFGQIDMPHSFVCKVTLNYTSGRDVEISFNDATQHRFQANTNIVFFSSLPVTKAVFEENNHNYNLIYTISGPSIQEYTVIPIPITKSDTVNAVVDF